MCEAEERSLLQHTLPCSMRHAAHLGTSGLNLSCTHTSDIFVHSQYVKPAQTQFLFGTALAVLVLRNCKSKSEAMWAT
jgi:hypothetical protein